MEKLEQTTAKEQRIKPRSIAEAGSTVHIQCGDREFVGKVENCSDGGMGILAAESVRTEMSDRNEIAITYSVPYGLVSRRAQVCWTRSDGHGNLKLGTSFLNNDEGIQTGYQKLWKRFSEANSLENAGQTWLALQCAMLSGVTRGMLVIGKPESSSYSPVSFWPEGHRGSLGLTEVVELALHEKRGVLRDQGQYDQNRNFYVCHIGYPVLLDTRVYGVVAIEIAVRPEYSMRALMRQLQWGVAWLELFIRREEGRKYSPENRQMATILELIAVSLEQKRFQDAATAVATELASLMKCERVSIGFLEGKYVQVCAVSHSAQFAEKSNLIAKIGLAMDESIEQLLTLVFPSPDEEAIRSLRCHENLAKEQGGGAICTTPFCSHEAAFGALTLERPPGLSFDKHTVELVETIAALIGPILETKRREDAPLFRKAWNEFNGFYRKLTGPEHSGLKLGVGFAVLALVFFIFATGEFRVAANTRLEGEIQRVIAAPFDGYIREAFVRPGDVVAEGAPLVQFDDNDLVLEKSKLDSQREQTLKEYREALGEADRSKVSVLKAQLGQTDAQLALVQSQLDRSNVKAPFDGVVVSGDLSQKLGSPSQRGDILFEIAPLDAYRVILEVDERDIAYVQPEQEGELVLTGHADVKLPFIVNKITPVSEAREGRNYFRVEAGLPSTLDFLRPGMKGIGKIDVGEHRLIWIWTKNLMDWVRLTFWTWWPDGL